MNRWLFLLLLTWIEGLAAIFFYFQIPSESQNAVLWGYSSSRLIIGLATLLIWLALAGIIVYAKTHPHQWDDYSSRLNKWLDTGSHTWALRVLLLVALLACLEIYLVTYLAFPIHLRPIILWMALMIIAILACSFILFRKPLNFKSGWNALDSQQKRVFWILLGISLIFFVLFIPQNMRGVQDRHDLYMKGGDEKITYPYVEWILKFDGKPEEWIYSLIVYEDYHYGYPFYLLSALVVLPVRLIYGSGFGDQTLINMFLMRQLISSLPMFVATIILVWMNTRFRSLGKSVLLYFLLFLLPNAAFYHIRFWHPDGMVVLEAVLTLFFLSRDRYRLSWNFYAAAIACGLASSTKLYGFFFVLTIPIYLLACRIDGKVAWRRLLSSAVLFVAAMSITILLSSPFLMVPSARQRLMQVQTEKSGEIQYGYNNRPDPENVYKLGLEAWLPFLESGFGPTVYLIFVIFSALVGCLWGKQRLTNLLMLSWFFTNAAYLINFSAVKSQHYWLPAMLPLFGAALNLTDLSNPASKKWFILPLGLKKALYWGTIILAVIIVLLNAYTSRSIITGLYN